MSPGRVEGGPQDASVARQACPYPGVAPDATKAQGVRTVADLLGVPYEAVMTIGDNFNGLKMLRDFPSGVAMETVL